MKLLAIVSAVAAILSLAAAVVIPTAVLAATYSEPSFAAAPEKPNLDRRIKPDCMEERMWPGYRQCLRDRTLELWNSHPGEPDPRKYLFKRFAYSCTSANAESFPSHAICKPRHRHSKPFRHYLDEIVRPLRIEVRRQREWEKNSRPHVNDDNDDYFVDAESENLVGRIR